MGDDVLAALITAAAGFLIAVLWFDLMFDVQVWRYRTAGLESISAYYRRVTKEASPMSRLVAVVMLVLLVALIVQAAGEDTDWWASAVSLPAAALAVGLAVGRIFGQARRLGSRADSPPEQAELARSILRGHLVCLAAMVVLLFTDRGCIIVSAMPCAPGFVAIDNRALVLGLVTWVAERPRPYSDVMEAWRTSCPRLPVWEEAVDHGLVERIYTREAGAMVHVTPAGREFVRACGR